jgi:cell division protein FtsB
MPKHTIKRGFDRVFITLAALFFLVVLFYPTYFGIRGASTLLALDLAFVNQEYNQHHDLSKYRADTDKAFGTNRTMVNHAWSDPFTLAYLSERIGWFVTITLFVHGIWYGIGRLAGWLLAGFRGGN